MAQLSLLSLVEPSTLAIAALGFLFLRMIYRLTLHPLASFPGPKIAAVTSLYGASYDLPPNSSYVKILPALHDKYGPIVRAWPNRLHIRDLDSYNQIYKPGTKFDKEGSFYRDPLTVHSLFQITDRAAAKQRKDMFQPYFSKSAIQRLESMIQDKVAKFLAVLSEASEEKKAMNLSRGYSCLTADTIMQYCYQKPFGALDAPDFQFGPLKAIEEFFDSASLAWYFPNFAHYAFALASQLPASMIKKYFPPIAATNWILQQCEERVVALKSREKSTSTSIPTIFDTMLNPDPAKGQYTPPLEGIRDDAALMFVAGTDTTANTLVQATWGILSNPDVQKKLMDELKSAMPPNSSTLSWATLETLPYLRAVIREALRFAYGVPGRIPRVTPSTGAVFCGKAIPPGTNVCHSAYCYHTDESLFTDAAIFKPERWLIPVHEFNELESKLVSFSRGSRGCLGINLAYAQLYLTLAHLFRRFDLQLYETTAATMEWDDCFTPKTKGHLKVLVRKVDE